MEKRLFTLLILCFLFSISCCHAQGTMSLEDCLRYALEHNVTLRQKAVDIEVRKQNVFESRNKFLPDVKAVASEQVGYGNFTTASGSMNTGSAAIKEGLTYTSVQVQSSMPLYTGGAIKNQKQADSFSLEAATADLEAARKDISIQVATKFLQALYHKNMAELSRKQCLLSKELLRRAEMKVAEGKSPTSDVANASAKVASDEYQLSQDEGNAILSKVSLAQLLTLPTPEEFEISEYGLDTGIVPSLSAMPMSASAIYENCVGSFPSILATKAGISEAEARVKVAEAGRLPNIELKASIASNYCFIFNNKYAYPSFMSQAFRDNHAEIVGVHATFPIFNRRATRVAINRAKLNVVTQHNKLEQQQQTLRDDIQRAYYNAHVSVSKYQAAQKAKEAAELSFNYEKDKYEAGRSSIFDLNQENQKWIKAQQDELQAKYEYFIRMKILDFYTK